MTIRYRLERQETAVHCGHSWYSSNRCGAAEVLAVSSGLQAWVAHSHSHFELGEVRPAHGCVAPKGRS